MELTALEKKLAIKANKKNLYINIFVFIIEIINISESPGKLSVSVICIKKKIEYV